MKQLIKKIKALKDFFLVPIVYFSAIILKNIRKSGFQRFPLCKKALMKVGVFPITNHYYEPQFDFSEIKHSFSKERNLPGINWNIEEQLGSLAELDFSTELENIQIEKKPGELGFYLKNGAFESGDAEYWYQLIRLKKPNKIFEIGSGNSTLMAIKAIQKNQQDNPDYNCKHVCIEPYDKPMLETMQVTFVKKKVEDIDISFFSELEDGDILFIDSTHIIRPEGDVLYEYLQLLPSLKKGVIVHVHDIFTPMNYPDGWIRNNMIFWNEQYLLEAFLCHNSSWKIIASLNHLCHNHHDALKKYAHF